MVYLASQSPRRKEILKNLGIKFKVVNSNYEEKHKKVSPSSLVLEHAVGKALGATLPRTARSGWVIGADTLVYAKGSVLGKPKTENEALKMLRMISGRGHYVYTGVAVKNIATGRVKKAYCKTKVVVKKLSKNEMLSYIKAVNSYDKAGAYAIQMKPKIVTRIVGSYTNVVGLPKEIVKKLI